MFTNPRNRFIGLVLVFVVIGIVVVSLHATSSTKSTMSMGTTSTAAPANAMATNTVSIANYAFSPMVITVKVGTTVTWTNTDAVRHTVTVDSGDMPSSSLLERGTSYSYTFTKAGTVTYHCDPHPYMKGTVVVTN